MGRHRIARLAVVAAGITALAACAAPTEPAGPPDPPSPAPSEAAPSASDAPGSLEPGDIVGVSWQPAPEWLDSTVTEKGMGNTRTPFVELHADGSVEGSDGCNGASGRWTLTEGRLGLELGPSTLIGCAGPAVPSLLASAESVVRDGDALVLTLEDGSEGRLVPAAG